MAKDDEKTEIVQPATEETVVDAFTKASTEVEAQRKEAAASEKDTPQSVPEKQEPQGDDKTPEELPEVSVDETETPEEPVEADVDTELSDEDSEILSGIDKDVINVCRDYYDEKEIIEIAKNKPELLEDIRAELDILDEKEPEELPTTEEKAAAKEVAAEFEELKLKLDPDIVGKDVKGAMEAMATRLNSYGKNLSEQKKGLDEQKDLLQAEKNAVFNNRIDACFDRHAKGLFAEAKKAGLKVPKVDLGRSSFFEGKKRQQLTRSERAQVRLRQRLYAHAKTEVELTGVPIERAIESEIQKELNKGGKKAATQELINNLNTEGKRAINRPTRRISQQKGERKFASDYEENEYRMVEAEREAGLRA